jgi:hypothetical protein
MPRKTKVRAKNEAEKAAAKAAKPALKELSAN